MDVPAFSIDRYKVTNGEYLKFVAAGGYRNRSLWSAEAWAWKEAHGIAYPLFWASAGVGVWNYRGMFEEIPLPLNWPVYVSHAEASAYARWAGKRLPTEAEWQRSADGIHQGVDIGNEPTRGIGEAFPMGLRTSPRGAWIFRYGALGSVAGQCIPRQR